ncbi:hypothetical protein [Maritalea sp.]|jgi:hypothetical protein|uniref:hypothetical protein n=1 Tax=Maritalea sp. TaxID=2003361 RepID=UPI0039E6DCB5
MENSEIIDWLMAGDVAVQYQTRRDLLGENRFDLRDRIASQGWGKQFLDARNPDGSWGRAFYQMKWTSSHYTLLDLRNLEIAPDILEIRAEISMIIANEKSPTDGGIGPFGLKGNSDVCVNGMFLHYASYFDLPEKDLKSILDFLLAQHMGDGGFNCRSNRAKPHHSSLHSTCSVLEGFLTYLNAGYTYRADEVRSQMRDAEDFLLLHQLFISDRTGLLIEKGFLKLSYPYRWRYSILRGLDYFRAANRTWDDRLQPATEVLKKKRRADGRWNVQAKHPGQTHFDMERAGQPSRWVTLFALRVFKHFGVE